MMDDFGAPMRHPELAPTWSRGLPFGT